MKSSRYDLSSKQTGALLGVLTLIAILALPPLAFAQQASQGPSSSGQGQQGGIPLGPPYGTSQPMHKSTFYALIGGSAIAIAIGIGIAVRRKRKSIQSLK